jgi:hypothetical protein
MSLVELPSNNGTVFAVDPHAVTAVQPYRSTIAGSGSALRDMCTVWLGDRSIFVCAWTTETTVGVLNAARHAETAVFAAGYAAGIAADRIGTDVRSAWLAYLKERGALR